jgi:triosephosphate isomerase
VSPHIDKVDVGIFPPALNLDRLARDWGKSRVVLGAQNGYPDDGGAFTGEISMAMLAAIGAQAVIVGHSERRTLFHETDADVVARRDAARKHGIPVIYCVGETLAERDAGQAEAVVGKQVAAAIASLTATDLIAFTLAYEPVWAIGTGRTASPQQAQDMHGFIRSQLAGRFGVAAAASVRILYGGSVKPGNAGELLQQPDVNGALVGGASLKAEDFLAIVAAAAAL